jgi:hypothetical protein
MPPLKGMLDMQKKYFLFLLFSFTVAMNFAQSSRQVDDWLRAAEQKANRAYSLAQKDPVNNLDTIGNLVNDVNRTLIRIDNYIMSGNELTESQIRRLQKINADLVSIARLL